MPNYKVEDWSTYDNPATWQAKLNQHDEEGWQLINLFRHYNDQYNDQASMRMIFIYAPEFG